MRIVALVSGAGTLLQALLDAAAQPDYPAKVVAVGANVSGIAGLTRAQNLGLPTFTVSPADHADRAAWNTALADAVAHYQPDVVVLAGFMKILGPQFLSRFPNRVVNTHPSLLPAFPGPGTKVVTETIDYGVKITGCTVHLVDGGVDTGPILAQTAVPVLPGADVDGLYEHIKAAERELLVDTIAKLAIHGCTITGRKVSIP